MVQGLTLFVKFFDQKSQRLTYDFAIVLSFRYLGKYAVKNKLKPMTEMDPYFLSKLKLPKDTKLKFYEEIKPMMIEPLDLDHSYHQAEIVDGDIIILERVLKDEEYDFVFEILQTLEHTSLQCLRYSSTLKSTSTGPLLHSNRVFPIPTFQISTLCYPRKMSTLR